MNKSRLTFSNFYYYLLLVSPLLLIYVVFFIIPVFQSMFFSVTNFNGLNLNFEFVGAKNYIVAFKDSKFLASMKNTIAIALGVTILQNVLAIAIALGFSLKFKLSGIVRTLTFAPCFLAPVVVAYLWMFIFSPDGLVNAIFGTDIVWLAQSKFAVWCIIFSHTWIWLGYSATIYLSNLQGISSDLKEAAAIDGCSPWQQFRHIILPLLAPSMTINISLAFTGSLKIFDLVLAMTNGGPNGATEVMGTYIMGKMTSNLYGYSSALSVLMMILIIITGQIITKALRKREEEIA